MTELRKFDSSFYRMTLPSGQFGQIKKCGREWHAEIRESETGNLVRPAGIWSTRKDAVEELRHLTAWQAKYEGEMR